MAERRSVKVGLLGLGVVGGGVARILTEKAERYTRGLGCPLELARVLVRDTSKERAVTFDTALLTTDAATILDDPEIDIVIEVIGGEEPAHQYIRQSLRAGKYVVTANKEVMAKHGSTLLSLAQEHSVDVLYEASVGGGIPIIAPLKRDLLANEIVAITAIINGTTNYILTAMSQDGSTFQEALAQAQALGYAEADPANDIEGIDAAYKLAILASLAFHGEVRPEQVYRQGIGTLIERDFRYARELGYAIKLLATARRDPSGSVQVRVHPAMLAEGEPLAKVDGVLNAVQVEGDLLGRTLFEGQGAGSLPTTSAVVADLLDASRSVVSGVRERLAWRAEDSLRITPIGELRTRYYLRMAVTDRPGVLGQIALVLGAAEISIASVLQQKADESAQTAEIVLMTHEAQEASMERALQELRELSVVAEIGTFLRVED
ncbi:MAG: homoserine dehydrogenase [Chloroflexi bacterium]|nr:homoserine dehydrogenase [Chloroflexota bacterium]